MNVKLVDGWGFKFKTLPLGHDAELWFQPPDTVLIYVDLEFQYRPDLRDLLWDELKRRFHRIQKRSDWVLKDGILILDISLAALGISKAQVQETLDFRNLPAPDENRHIGDLDISTGSDWLKRLNLRI